MQESFDETRIDQVAVESEQVNLVFITIAGNAVGYGHLSRCLALAEYAGKMNWAVSFLLFGDNDAFLRVKHAGFDCSLEPLSLFGCKGELAEVVKQINVADIAVVDFSHQAMFSHLEDVHQLFRCIRKQVRRIVVIDALGEQALAPQMPDMPIDILVAPYVGSTSSENPLWHYLEGPSYAILSSAYIDLPERIVREDANRILISCGGSDPRKLTALALNGIEEISKILEVRVIVGPLFSKNFKATLKGQASSSKHSIELIDSPATLAEHMIWCDLAIATTSLIKYELAATATPGVLISIDNVHELINRPFAVMETAIDLGIETTPQEIALHVESLLEDYEARASMAVAGRSIVDGNGARRLITEIMRSCCVTN